MAQSLFRELVRRNANVIIDVLAPAWSEAIVNKMPEVRHAIEMPVGHGKLNLASRYCLGRRPLSQRKTISGQLCCPTL